MKTTVFFLAAIVSTQGAYATDERAVERVMKLTRATQWRPVAAILLSFPTYHPQGMVKIGDDFFVSSVDIKIPTKRYPELRGLRSGYRAGRRAPLQGRRERQPCRRCHVGRGLDVPSRRD